MAPFSADVVNAVLHHMNTDHPEDNLLVARAFGNPDADTAIMTGFDGIKGHWVYSLGEHKHEVSVPWSTPITERPEIRREIVVLYDAACARLGIEPRQHD